jgi:hypothetical protein
VVKACDKSLRRAAEEVARSRYVAWDCLHRFDDEALAALSDDERDARWCSLNAEAAAKLKGGWRGKAAEGLGKQASDGKKVPLHVLRELQAHLATAAQNKQHKLELFQHRSLPWITGLLTLTVLLALGLSYQVFRADSPASLVPWARALLIGIPAGAVGGILSMSFSLGRADLTATIPDMRLSGLVTLTRPLLGATVAIPVLVFVQASYLKFAGFEGNLATLAFCFLGGFSERWFLGVMERFAVGKT